MNRPTASGVYKWASAGLTALVAYLLTCEGYAEIDWFLVGKGALAHIGAGLAALAVTNSAEKPTPAPEKTVNTLPVPVEPIKQTFFSKAELECKGQTCNCTFPGMHPTVMAMANDLRKQFGAIIVNSGYRCPEHNAAVGGSSSSYHMKGMAIDLKATGATPAELYDYLTARYPSKYGIGLYHSFVHIDCRTEKWARKASPDGVWKQFDYALA